MMRLWIDLVILLLALHLLIFEISEEQPFFNARVVVFNLAVESWEKLLLY